MKNISKINGKHRFIGTHPHGGDECILEIVGDADEESLSAGDHGHACCEVADHVVGCQVHPVDVWVQREVLETGGGGRKREGLE